MRNKSTDRDVSFFFVLQVLSAMFPPRKPIAPSEEAEEVELSEYDPDYRDPSARSGEAYESHEDDMHGHHGGVQCAHQ